MAYPYHLPLTIETRQPGTRPPDDPAPSSPPPFSELTTSPTTQNRPAVLHSRHAVDAEFFESNSNPNQNSANDGDSHPHASHDHELPSYSFSEAPPTYDQSALAHPFAQFTLRGFTRKTQMLIPAAAVVADGLPSYKLTFRTSPKMFSRKPDIVLTKADSLISPRTGAVAVAAGGEQELGKADFDVSGGGGGAWFPRARITGTNAALGDSPNAKFDVALESRNFVDWSFSAADVGILGPSESENSDKRFRWRLTSRPTAHILVSEPDGDVLARLTHSKAGTMAKNGEEIGNLAIFSPLNRFNEGDPTSPTSPINAASLDAKCPGFVPLVLTLAVTMINLRRMGRHHWNDEEGRRSSVATFGGRGIHTGVGVRSMSAYSMPMDGSGLRN